jgi:hypothetical protein
MTTDRSGPWWRLDRGFLDHTVPRAAVRAFAQPFWRLAAAFLAGEDGFKFHWFSSIKPADVRDIRRLTGIVNRPGTG